MRHLILIVALLFPYNAMADQSPQQELLKNATYVLEEILSTPDMEVPSGLISKAKAIMVFPTMLKVGFIGAVRYGKGVVTTRDSETGGWSPPAFVTTIGGSFGFQAGAQAVDLVLIITTERGLKGLLKDNFTLGGDIAVTVGPVGRYAEAGVDLFLQGDVYSYSRSKGIFAGISLKGTVIKPNWKYNREYYKENLSPHQIMIDKVAKNIPETSQRFMRDFNRLAPTRQQADKLAQYENREIQPGTQTAAPQKPVQKPEKPLW